MPTLSQKVADFVLSKTFGDIPGVAVKKAKRSLLDCFGVALAGTKDATSEIIKAHVLEMGGRPDSTLWGSSEKVPVTSAALANGVFSHVLDYDDASFIMLGHPSAVVCPAVTVVGEWQNSTGKEVLTAYVLGVEVACRVGAAMTQMYSAGWHSTSTAGIFGAAAGAGKLMGLDQTQMTYALGLAASMAAGIKRNFGSSAKSFHAGQAASNGIEAAMLAQHGITSSPEAIEGRYGFAELYSGEFRPEQLGAKMGRPYLVDIPGFNLKRYPSCVYTHTAIDAVLALRTKNRIDTENVSEIDCEGGPAAVDAVIYNIPENELQARFSMPFCLALALAEGRVMLPQFVDSNFHARKLRALMKKVNFSKLADSGSRDYGDPSSSVRIKMADGTVFSKSISRPKGHPKNPLNDEELLEKFRTCASTILSEDDVQGLEHSVLNLEQLQTVEPLVMRLGSRRLLKLSA